MSSAVTSVVAKLLYLRFLSLASLAASAGAARARAMAAWTLASSRTTSLSGAP